MLNLLSALTDSKTDKNGIVLCYIQQVKLSTITILLARPLRKNRISYDRTKQAFFKRFEVKYAFSPLPTNSI
jgi:predicted transcriptional regulator